MTKKLKKVILLYQTSRSHSREILRGVAKYCQLCEPWLCFSPTPLFTDLYANPGSLAWVKKIDPDGIIISNVTEDYDEIIALGLPTIVHRIVGKPDGKFPTILGKGQLFGKLVAEYLLDRGFQKLGYCGYRDYVPSQERCEGFVNRIKEAGFEPYLCNLPGSNARISLEKDIPAIVDWLKPLPKPLGVMACTDEVSQNVARACRIAGLNVPEEVAIVGVANDEIICELSQPPLSSLALNNEKAGYEAAQLLSKLMSGEEKMQGQAFYVQPKYVVTRRSTDILTVEDAEVAKALNYIRKNSRKTIQVTDVVNATVLSRRSLETRFKKIMGRSILKEIRRRKIEEFTKLLLGTNMSISQIAAALNAPNIDNISRYFKSEKGMTPLAYRKQYGHQ